MIHLVHWNCSWRALARCLLPPFLFFWNLEGTRETEAAVARVGGIIKDAQEGSATKG